MNTFNIYRTLLLAITLNLALGGCSANIAQQRDQAQTRLKEQSQSLQQASVHLAEAQTRLAAEPDPRRAGDELRLGADNVKQAVGDNQQIQQQVQDLGKTAQNLQATIDKHKDDLLGPRGHRILWGLAIALTLILLGVAFLQLGPLLGGAWGGGLIVAGHLLTAFLLPVWHLLSGWAAASFRWMVSLLGRLGTSSTATATAATPPATGGANAP